MLYKYFPISRTDVIEHGLIRFTQPGDFNDPFELHPSFDLMSKADIAALPPAPDEPEMRILTPEAFQGMLSALLPGLQTFMREHQGKEGAYLVDNNRLAQATFDSKFGILCLTETPDSLLMWAHYANSHNGFVLQFDESHEFFAPASFEGQAFELTRVEYASSRPVLSYSSLHSTALYYRKSPEWSYEREWRLIRPLIGASKELPHDRFPQHLFELPPDAVRGIIIGLGVSHPERMRLMELFSQPHFKHVAIYQTCLSKNDYKLEFAPPLDGNCPPDELFFTVCESR